MAALILHRLKHKQGNIPYTKPQNLYSLKVIHIRCGLALVTWTANDSRLPSPQERSTAFGNRQFTYKELKLMTANFKEEIGRGGFGSVFLGYLENGSPVAVKMRSKTSSQGDKEFLAEVGYSFVLYLPCAFEN